MKELRQLARFLSGLRLDDVPSNAVETARFCVLDTVSVALGARDNPLCESVRNAFLGQEGTASRPASVWGAGRSVNPSRAAFLNAMAAHTLELDDVHTASKTHIGTVVIPAAWALAESLGKSGRDLLEAVICGYETMARIGMAFGVTSHRNRGWHVTGTAGTFGAAAACGKLLGFSEEEFLSAFGLAGTQSASTWAFLTGGATNKVLHPARAASSGLESCILVRAGMRGTSHILDAADGGIIPMMSDAYDYSFISRWLGDAYEILNVDKKPYPCCRSAHGSIDAAIALKKEHAPAPSEIEKVLVDTYLVGYKQVGFSEGSTNPRLPTEAKFSTPYVVACAILNGKVGLDDFAPEKIADPARRALLARVQVREAAEFSEQYPAHWGCRMTIVMKNGVKYSRTVRDASGSVASPLTAGQLTAKTYSTCSVYETGQVAELIGSLLSLGANTSLPALPR